MHIGSTAYTQTAATRSELRSTRGAASRLLTALVLCMATVLLSACGPSFQDLVEQQYSEAVKRVTTLANRMGAGQIRNARIIGQYSRYIAKKRPDVAEIAEELGKEGTPRGLAYKSLADRINKIDRKPKDEKAADKAIDELLRIQAAADPAVFNDSLIDVINVLADMSEGKLPRMNVPRTEKPAKEGAGSHLVGNPRYGNWRTDSSGNSFWAWYGQYALFRTVFGGGRPYYYGSWYGNRGWSYYGDVGRHYYGTRSDTSRWNRASKTYPNTKPRKTYGRLSSSRRLSTYGRASTRAPGSSLKRASSYASSSRGSRSGSRGK